MKKVKSVIESVSFSAQALLGRGVVSPETDLLVRQLAVCKPEEKDDITQKVQASIAPKVRAALTSIGASLPTDLVPVYFDLGSLLYDIYESGSKKPEAPLAKMAFQRRMMEAAARFEKEEIELSDEEFATIKGVLSDDSKWGKVQGHAYTIVTKEDKEENTGITLSNQGLAFFGKILDAAVALFEEKNESTGQESIAEAK